MLSGISSVSTRVKPLARRPSAIFGTNFAKGDPAPAAKEQWHFISIALRLVKLHIGGKSAVHLKCRMKLFGGGIGLDRVGHFTLREFAEVKIPGIT